VTGNIKGTSNSCPGLRAKGHTEAHQDTASPTWSPSCTTRSRRQRQPGTPCMSSTGCRQPPSPASSARQQHNCSERCTTHRDAHPDRAAPERPHVASDETPASRAASPVSLDGDEQTPARQPSIPHRSEVGGPCTGSPHGDRHRLLPAALPVSPAAPSTAWGR